MGENKECRTLEDLLQKHFGLKDNLCTKNLDDVTEQGIGAYKRMTNFLYDLSSLLNDENKIDINAVITELDNILDENIL